MYQIIHQESGLCCENFVIKTEISKTLKYWRENGMAGNYVAVAHDKGTVLNRIW